MLNQVVNNRGEFLQKAATTINYLKRKKAQHYKYLVNKMSRVHLFNLLPPEEIHRLFLEITSRTYTRDSVIIRKGNPGDSLFIIDKGSVDIYDDRAGEKKIATIVENDVLGEIALVTGEPRTATAIAATDVRLWVILKDQFDRLLGLSPTLAEAVKDLVSTRIGDLREMKTIHPSRAKSGLMKP